MQVLKGCTAIFTGGQPLFYQGTFLEDDPSICRFNICSGIHIINSTFQSLFCVLEHHTGICDRSTGQHFPFLINSQVSKLFLISYVLFCGSADNQVNPIGFSIQHISVRYGNLFQVYGILCLFNRDTGCAIGIGCRHLCNQFFSCFITVNAIDRTGYLRIASGILLHDLNLCHLDPFHTEIHIFLICDTFSKYQCQVLCGGPCGDLISGIILGNASFHGHRPGTADILCLCQRCGKIELCAAGHFYACTCRTGLSG